jgi:hypothetical protein
VDWARSTFFCSDGGGGLGLGRFFCLVSLSCLPWFRVALVLRILLHQGFTRATSWLTFSGLAMGRYERLLKVQQYSCIDQRNCELLRNTMNLSIQRFCCFCCYVSKGWSGNTTNLTRYLKQTQQYLEET